MKKLRFMNDLIIKSLPGKETRRLVGHFIVKYDDRYIVGPEVFITDYASIPKIVPRWIVDQDDGIIREAAVLHDYLYSWRSLGVRNDPFYLPKPLPLPD